MTEQEYRKAEGINQSRLKLYLKSPKHYFRNEPVNETEDMRIGTALHSYILQGNMLVESRETKTGVRADADILLASEKGKVSLHTDSMQTVEGMINAMTTHPTAMKLLSDIPGESEKAIFWKPESGLTCKALIDRLAVSEKVENTLIPFDLKTCQDASEQGFLKACRDFDYPIQAAFYMQGLRANYPNHTIAPFTFVLIEKKPPHYIGIYQIDSSGLWVIENWIHETLWKIANTDPSEAQGYTDTTKNAGIKETFLPAYYLEKFNLNQ